MNEILNNYELNIKKIEPLKKGFASNKWIIIDDKKNKYVLKELGNQPSKRISFFLKVQSNIAYAPKIILTKKNKLYSLYNNKFYYITKFINFKKNKKNDIEKVGKILGILHSDLSKIKLGKSNYLDFNDNRKILKNYLKYYKEKDIKEYIDIIQYKLDILNELKIEDINLKKLNKQIIHGDFYIDNLFFCENNFWVIDFDQCCSFYKEYEIMRAMFMLVDWNESKNALNVMQQFIKGYNKSNKIFSFNDAYNLYLYIQANSLSCLNPKDYLKKEKKQFAIKRFKILKFLKENREEIINILKGEYL